jgi:hypothetical protein
VIITCPDRYRQPPTGPRTAPPGQAPRPASSKEPTSICQTADGLHRQGCKKLNHPRVPHTTVVSLDDRIPDLLQPAMAAPALFAAAEPDPLDAALQALCAAATTFGRDDYPTLLEQVRRTYSV